MAIIVLNEWVFHDLLGENGIEAQQETSDFLDVFFKSSDMLALPNENRWLRKTFQLANQGAEARLRRIARQFQTLLWNPGRTVDTRNMEQADIPQHLLSRIPEEDVYLVRAYVLADADLLVTTDTGLFDSLIGSDVSCIMRDKFLSEYLP